MKKIKRFDIIALVATIGLIGWIITDYFGGMMIFLFSYSFLILPILIIYLISIIETISSIIKNGLKKNKIKFVAHLIGVLFIVVNSFDTTDLFKSERLITAILRDDLFHYTLILREDGSCENNVVGFMGFKDQYKGKFYFKDDTIIFTQKPYDNDFLPDTILLDTIQDAIFINRDKSNNFITKKEWLNHFEIE